MQNTLKKPIRGRNPCLPDPSGTLCVWFHIQFCISAPSCWNILPEDMRTTEHTDVYECNFKPNFLTLHYVEALILYQLCEFIWNFIWLWIVYFTYLPPVWIVLCFPTNYSVTCIFLFSFIHSILLCPSFLKII